MTFPSELDSRSSPAASARAETPDGAKRRQILEGARRVFLRDGFDGASMNDVVREAGVSKGTLYVYFQSKEALFEALIREGKARQAERLAQLSTDGEPADTLRRYGTSLLSALAAPDSIAQVRLVLGVSGKSPQIGRAFYEAGIAHGIECVAAYLEAETLAGRLHAPDPRRAAIEFLELCKAGTLARLLFGVQESVPQEEIDANVDRAVRAILALYGQAARRS